MVTTFSSSLRLSLTYCSFLVRNTLIAFAAFSIFGAIVVFVTSIMLIIALRKVREAFVAKTNNQFN